MRRPDEFKARGHVLLSWSADGQYWSCRQCNQEGDKEEVTPESKTPCLSPRERNPENFHPWGHGDLRSSDLGYWSCRTCGQRGDDYTHPRDFKCEPVEQTGEKLIIVSKNNLTDQELEELETEEEFLRNYDLKKYPAQAVTTDLCVFTIRDGRLCMLLIKRGGHPEKGKYALPGGFVNVNESLEEGAARELYEETGLVAAKGSESAGGTGDFYLEQLRTYGYPGRDPRGFIVSTAYIALAPNLQDPVAGDDAQEAAFMPIFELLADPSFDFAFDHRAIVEDAVKRLRDKLKYAPLAPRFLENEDEFTISELRHVYEIILGQELNKSNFRRKVKSVAGWLEPTGQKRATNLPGGRLSDGYRAREIEEIYPPLRY